MSKPAVGRRIVLACSMLFCSYFACNSQPQDAPVPDEILDDGHAGEQVPGNEFTGDIHGSAGNFQGSDTSDKDNDGVLDTHDNCPLNPNTSQTDTDNDSIGDTCDDDDDGDGVPDGFDNCPLMANAAQNDQDGNGIGDVCDEQQDDVTDAIVSPVPFEELEIYPNDEDTAGPAVVITADMNDDGCMDIVSAWDDSQPIKISLQCGCDHQSERCVDAGGISFNTFSIAGSGPFARVSDLDTADFDEDGNLDIVVAIRDTGFTPDPFIEDGGTRAALIILFAPDDPSDNLNWFQLDVSGHFECALAGDPPQPFTQFTFGRDADELGYQGVDTADFDGDGDIDIVAAWNGANMDFDPNKEIEYYPNPGPANARDLEVLESVTVLDVDLPPDGEPDICIANPQPGSGWIKRAIDESPNDITSVKAIDVDQDGLPDVVYAQPDSATFDTPWIENVTAGFETLAFHPIGESDNGLNKIVVEDSDGQFIDFDDNGSPDVLIFSEVGGSAHWFRGPTDPIMDDPIDPSDQFFPWEVYDITFAEAGSAPYSAMDAGDLDGNGVVNPVLAAGNEIFWHAPVEGDIFGIVWSEFLIFRDEMFFDAIVRSVKVVDIDGDGRNDVLACVDRVNVGDDALLLLLNVGE